MHQDELRMFVWTGKLCRKFVLTDFYLFDLHARDLHGIPDPNGTTVVKKFKNILNLEQYFYSVSACNSDQYERCHVIAAG